MPYGHVQKLFGAAVHGRDIKAFIHNLTYRTLLFIGGERKDGRDFKRLATLVQQFVQLFVISLGGGYAADGKHGIKAPVIPLQAMGFASVVGQNVFGYFAYALRMEQEFFGFSRLDLIQILFSFNVFEVRSHIVVVHFELQHLFITNGIGDDIGVKFMSKDACSSFRT